MCRQPSSACSPTLCRVRAALSGHTCLVLLCRRPLLLCFCDRVLNPNAPLPPHIPLLAAFILVRGKTIDVVLVMGVRRARRPCRLRSAPLVLRPLPHPLRCRTHDWPLCIPLWQFNLNSAMCTQ